MIGCRSLGVWASRSEKQTVGENAHAPGNVRDAFATRFMGWENLERLDANRSHEPEIRNLLEINDGIQRYMGSLHESANPGFSQPARH